MGHTVIYDPVRDRVVLYGGFTHLRGSIDYFSEVWALSLGGSPTWSRLDAGGGPPDRYRHTAIYDPVNDRMVVFGGGYFYPNLFNIDYNDTWALSLAEPPTWERLVPNGVAPRPRNDHTAIYDSPRHRMLVFGGEPPGGGGLNDLWSLELQASPSWTSLTTTSPMPPPSSEHSAIYDPVRDQMVVFGPGDDAWALTLTPSLQWNQLNITPAPRARKRSTAVFDPTSDQMLVFGGVSYFGLGADSPLNDTWAMSLAAPSWRLVIPEEPMQPREDHSVVYDYDRDRIVVFGGHNGGGGVSDVWVRPLADESGWRKLQIDGPAPPPRFGHTAIFDRLRDRMIIFGGADNAGGWRHFNDLWELSFASLAWRQLVPSGPAPSARRGHSAVYDETSDRMVVFGGFDEVSRFSDVRALKLSGEPVWSTVMPVGGPPEARWGHAAIYDSSGDRMIVFGGAGSNLLSDTWLLSLSGGAHWSTVTSTGPSARFETSAVYDRGRDRMLLYGGFTEESSFYFADVWSLNLVGDSEWEPIGQAGPTPPARLRHAAVYDPRGDRMIVVGGHETNFLLNDAWTLNFGPSLVQVQVDIKPGSDDNVINIRSRGVLPVAVLSDIAFNATEIIPETTTLAGAPVRRKPNGRPMCSFDDVDGDGRLDALLHFGVADLQLGRLATVARLEGETAQGSRIVGSDNVRIVSAPGTAEPEATPASDLVRVPVPWLRSIPLRVELTVSETRRVTVEILDVAGRRLLSRDIEGRPGSQTLEIPESLRWRAGIYLMRLMIGETVSIARIVLL